ncbi:MAG TPA: TlpA disulfide reductase family protein [Nocardioidaceae bacterium]|nr:TlpA disulfide reductase family protein [Nocardioidaceae bacterium]
MTRSRPRTMRAVAGAAATSAVLLLASCAAGPTGSSSTTEDAGRFAVDVDVDTPELRAAKRKAGLEECPAPAGQKPDAANPLPDVTLPCLGGGPDVDLATLRGPMVVNLWAQWCPPCREELPFYQQLHEEAAGDVAVLGVDYQDTRPDWALDLLDQTGVTYPSVADPAGKLRVPFRVRGLPGIVFVDEDGEVVAVEYVVIESFGQLTDLVDQHLGVAVGAAG